MDLKNINFNYSQSSEKILQDLNAHFETKNWYAIIGESGSGKTTLAKIMSGILIPSNGECLIEGQDITQLSEEKRSELRQKKIQFIHQDFNLIDYLTVLENVMLPDILSRKTPDQERGEKILDQLGILEKRDVLPDFLSGGQKQRVAIARALYADGKIIIADEPTGNLDENNRDEILNLFSELKKQGKLVITITHDSIVASQADQILRLESGHLI
ncbi:MAG: ABC transporter ATP-binding protein [Allobaculum sp.]|nr:ABC transporter ATP-binding protein [Allobaculum sp.]